MNRDFTQPLAYQPYQQPGQGQNPQGYQGYQGQPGGYQGAPGSHQGYQQGQGYGGGGYSTYQPPKKKSPWLKILAIGCLGLTILMIGGCIISYFVIKSAVSGMVDKYTSTTPAPIPTVALSPEEIKEVRDRANDFAAALDAGPPPQPLVLTADEINALIQNHPDWKELSGKAYVSIEDNLLKGQVSFPLDALGMQMVRGRYVNGSASFDVFVRNGVLHVYMKDLVVNDKSVPQEFMQGMSSENMAKDLQTNNPKAAEFFRKIDSLVIQDGKIIITPKP